MAEKLNSKLYTDLRRKGAALADAVDDAAAADAASDNLSVVRCDAPTKIGLLSFAVQMMRYLRENDAYPSLSKTILSFRLLLFINTFDHFIL